MGGKKKQRTKWRKLPIGPACEEPEGACARHEEREHVTPPRDSAERPDARLTGGAKSANSRVTSWVAVPLVPVIPHVPPQCYAENGPDNHNGEAKGCYVNGLWIPNSELRRYRSSAPPPPPVGPSMIPPVRARPDGTPDPFVPTNQHYYLYFILPKPPYHGNAAPPQPPPNNEESSTESEETVHETIPNPEPPQQSPYWSSTHPTPRQESEAAVSPPAPSGEAAEQRESSPPPSASQQACSYTYPGYTFGPSLYGTVTGAYPVPLVLTPPLGHPYPQLVSRSRYYRATGRRKPKSFADFGMDNGLVQGRVASQEPEPTDSLANVPVSPGDNCPLLSDLSEEDLTDSTACTIEAKLQTSSSSSMSNSHRDDVEDLATRTIASSMDEAKPEIVSALHRRKLSASCFDSLAARLLESILKDVRAELRKILRLDEGANVAGQANKLACEILSDAVSASAKSLLDITRREEQRQLKQKSQRGTSRRDERRPPCRADGSNLMTNIRDKAHFLGVTATSPEAVLQGMLGTGDVSEPAAEDLQSGYSSQTEALLRDAEMELSKLERLTHKANSCIYRLAYDSESDRRSSPSKSVDLSDSECRLAGDDSQSVGHDVSTLKDGRPDSSKDIGREVPHSDCCLTVDHDRQSFKDVKRLSEIVVHEVDDLSEAGSEDVEMLGHRYEVSEERKHIYVNQLSLATELMLTSGNRPRDRAEDSGVQSGESADEADVLDGARSIKQDTRRRPRNPMLSALKGDPLCFCCCIM